MLETEIANQNPEMQIEARLAAIVDNSFDAIISKTLSGVIVSWNQAAETMFGYSAREAIGQTIYSLVPSDRRDEEAEIIQRLALGERIETFETLRQRRDGSLVPVSITVSPIRNEHGCIVAASQIARDISGVKENERRLRLLMREVNHRVKNQYAVILAVISQTATRETDIQTFEARVRERIMALSCSQDLLSAVDWAGVDIRSLIAHQITSFNLEKVNSSGPDLLLDSNAVLNLGMALHELSMNHLRFAIERGSVVELTWTVEAVDGEEQFQLRWRETVSEDTKLELQSSGFGSLVLRRIVAAALGGASVWAVEGGALTWRLTAPLARIQAPEA